MSPILWLTLWLAGLQIGTPARQNAPPARGSIQGVVFRAGAAPDAPGQQLADARLELKPGNRSVFTNATGSFSFGNLTPGQYKISVARDGFVLLPDRQHGITEEGLTIKLGAGENVKGIALPMIPAPAIEGTVFDPHGKRLATALILAYQRQYTPLGPQIKIVNKAMTNDLGEFRLFGLNFGTYFVSAGYGDRERAVAIGKTELSENVSKPDDGYATTFYDHAEDISRAQTARVLRGSAPPTLNIYFTDSARLRIRGQVLPPIGGTKIVLAPRGGDLSSADYYTQPSASGAFEIRGVSPGIYFLLATAGDGAMTSDVIGVNITNRDIEGLRVALGETISISGELSQEGTQRANLQRMRVRLTRSTTEFDQRFDISTVAYGAFMFEHIPPLAEYDVSIEPLPERTYIKSIYSGRRDILAGQARLTPGAPLQITLAEATGVLDVHVTNGMKPGAGAQVVLIPEQSLRRRTDRYITNFADPSGDLTLTAIPPGRYTAYAFEDIEPFAYYAFAYNPALEDRFQNHATALKLDEGSKKSIQLSVISAAETAGAFQ